MPVPGLFYFLDFDHMIRFIRRVSASVIFILMVVPATPALADCANPVGVMGDVIWSAVSESPAYCDGTTWHAFPKGKEVESWTAPSQFPVLNNPTPHSTDYFGYAVAISGSLAVVGVYQDESDGTTGISNAGRAYVFNADTGVLVTTLNNPTPHASDFFGYSVAIDGNTIVVGAYQDESDGEAGVSAAGRAYVFNATTGALITALNNPNSNANDHFGYSVGVSGNLAVVGALNDEFDGGTGTTNDGRAYVYNATTGALVSTLNNPSPHATDNFGYSVAIDGNVAVVGAHMDESDGGAGVSAAAALRHRVRRAISYSIQRTVSCNIARAMRG